MNPSIQPTTKTQPIAIPKRPLPPAVPPSTHNPVTSWNEFKNLVGQLAEKKINLLYRGQSDATWNLKTTFHRESDKNSMSMPSYLELVEGEMHYQLSSRLNDVINTANQFEFASYIALLRNHGFPTPLLDWSLSPYVAAYFAFREADNLHPKCRRVRVYVFDFDLWRKTYQQHADLKDPSPYISVIRPFAKYNPRQLAQNTVYTLTNISDMDSHIQAHQKGQTFIYKFDLSADIWSGVMQELDLMGINERTLFPDLDGLCRDMKRRHF